MVEDLGIDGDDAVELFEKFAREFSVDLAELNLGWERHFQPEGTAVGGGCFVVIGAATVVGSGLSTLVRGVPFWAGTAVALVFFGWIYTRYFMDAERFETEPVTVREMVEAARSGKWVKRLV